MYCKQSFLSLSKKWVVLLAILLIPCVSLAQRIEYGIALGGVNYAGDLVRGYQILNQNLGIQGIYRINLNQEISFKLGLLYANISGSDANPYDALGKVRHASFHRKVYELTGMLEYHFLDYKSKYSRIKWSPYFFAGLGLVEFRNVANGFQPILPFGGGFKHLIGKQLSIAVEFGVRKTWFDKLDEISETEDAFNLSYNKSNRQYGNPRDTDWYHFFNVSVSYIPFRVSCKYRYIPNNLKRHR